MKQENVTDSPVKPFGVKGWVLLFVLRQLVGVAYGFVVLIDFDSETTDIPLHAPSLLQLLMFEQIDLALRIVGGIIGILLTLGLSPTTPGYWRVFLLLTVVMAAAETYLLKSAAIELRGTATLEGLEEIDTIVGSAVAQSFWVGGSALVWSWYWSVSRRVANTFRRPGAVDATPSEHGRGQAHSRGHVVAKTADRFRGRPTQSCHSCGRVVLATAEFCPGCRSELTTALR